MELHETSPLTLLYHPQFRDHKNRLAVLHKTLVPTLMHGVQPHEVGTRFGLESAFVTFQFTSKLYKPLRAYNPLHDVAFIPVITILP